MSELLMISLFALQLALLIRIVFTSLIETGKISAMLLAGWMIVYFLWSFVRDTNLYATPVTIAFLIILLWLRKFQKSGYIGVMIMILSGIFMLGWITSRNSIRPTVEMSHVYKSDLLPFPLRVAELQAMGMPAPGSSTYQKWFEANSVNTFTRFMITHPGYVATKLGRDLLLAFGENIQQYFKIPELGTWRELLIQFGNAIHPESATPFFMSAIILIALLNFGLKNQSTNSRPWGLVGMWLFMVASLTIFISIMAGSYGLYRHTLFSTMAYRLFMWIFLIISLDLGFDRNEIE